MALLLAILGLPGCELLLGDIPPRADVDSGAACEDTQHFYPDEDGDGYGDDGRMTSACAPPADTGWVRIGGDCQDQLPDVFPGQQKYFGKGYFSAASPRNLSFDYNCDGVETASATSARASACSLPLVCTGSGFAPYNPARAGNDIDAYCGSDALVMCTIEGVLCVPITLTDGARRYECR